MPAAFFVLQGYVKDVNDQINKCSIISSVCLTARSCRPINQPYAAKYSISAGTHNVEVGKLDRGHDACWDLGSSR